jgi:hypothetical protein
MIPFIAAAVGLSVIAWFCWIATKPRKQRF